MGGMTVTPGGVWAAPGHLVLLHAVSRGSLLHSAPRPVPERRLLRTPEAAGGARTDADPSGWPRGAEAVGGARLRGGASGAGGGAWGEGRDPGGRDGAQRQREGGARGRK